MTHLSFQQIKGFLLVSATIAALAALHFADCHFLSTFAP